MSTAVDVGSARAVLTGCFRPLLLVVAAFHSESTRAKLHPGQFHSTLEQLLAGADAQAQSAGLDRNLYQQAKYAAIALADDLALHTDWDHASEWNRYLLEQRHFNSSFAGQQFFDQVHRLRQTLAGVQDPLLREQVLGVLEVHYTALRLGFRGRYRGGAAAAEVDGLANAILALLVPQGDKAVRNRVWAEAYREAPKGRVLDPRMLWWWPIPVGFLVAAAVWIVLSLGIRGNIEGFDRTVDERTGAAPAAGDPR